jgi:hypothetical protein
MNTKSIPSLLLGATVLGAAGLGLSAGQANANQIVRTCWFGTQIIGVSECGANSYTLGDKQITYLQNPSTADAGEIGFIWDDNGTPNPHPYPQFLDDTWTVDTYFTPNVIGGSPGGTNGTLKYKLSIVDLPSHGPNPLVFDKVNLNWAAVMGPNVTVTKQVFSDAFTTNILTLTGNGSMGDISAWNLKDIWILDTYNVPAGEGLDNFKDAFTQVPGPLPLLGAGTAFGFSRRLRRRSKQRFSLG